MENSEKNQNLFMLSWPIFLELLMQVLLGNLNVWMISHYYELAVAAVGAVNQLLFMSIFIYGFVTIGSQILIAQYLGSKNYIGIKNIMNTGMIAASIIGLLLSSVFFSMPNYLLAMMNLDTSLVNIGSVYLKILGSFFFINALNSISVAILRTHGLTQQALLIPIMIGLLSASGNYLSLYQLDLGIRGLAFSGVLGNLLGFLIAQYLLKKYIYFYIGNVQIKQFSIVMLKKILNYGIPSSGEALSYQGAQLVITMIVSSLGANVLIAKSYVQAVSQLISLCASAISQGNQIIVGRKVGAKNYLYAKKQGYRSMSIGIIVSLILCILVCVFSDSLMHIFTNNQEVMQIAREVFLIAIILESARAVNMVLVGSLNASGDVKYPLFCSLIVLWGISLPFSYFLAIHLHLGLVGVWLAYAIDETLRSMLMIKRWQSNIWQKQSISRSENLLNNSCE